MNFTLKKTKHEKTKKSILVFFVANVWFQDHENKK